MPTRHAKNRSTNDRRQSCDEFSSSDSVTVIQTSQKSEITFQRFGDRLGFQSVRQEFTFAVGMRLMGQWIENHDTE